MSYVYSGRITPIYNYEVIKEYKEVLSRKKFNLNSSESDQSFLRRQESILQL